MKVVIIVIALSAIALFTWFWIDVVRETSRQREMSNNIRLARQHAVQVTPQLHSDPRFTNINLIAFGRPAGPLFVKGMVASDKDLADLHEALAATRPPVPVTWQVIVATNLVKMGDAIRP